MMPGGMSQGEGSANNQTGALGVNSLQLGPMGSPVMNRMETGGDPGLAERDREREREAGAFGISLAACYAFASEFGRFWYEFIFLDVHVVFQQQQIELRFLPNCVCMLSGAA